MDEREIEDDRALSVVGARTDRLYLPEALYRKDLGGTPLYDSDSAVFREDGPAPGDELSLVERQIAQRVDAADPDLILAPLGVGGHVDHMLVSAAARKLNREVLHYEDVPYVLYGRCEGWQSRVVARPSYTHICSAWGWSAKTSGIECYTSQRDVLWYSPETWRQDLDGYARAIGNGKHAERLWSFDER